jgi:ribokinase
MQLEIPLLTVTYAADLARRHGARVVLNPAPAQPLNDMLLSQVDYIIPNQSEAMLLTGQSSSRLAAERLREAGVRSVVVTLGDQGVLILDDHGEIQLGAHRVQVVDTTAAGDAFVGAFAVALAEGRSTLHAARWGNAAGALAVTRAGAQPSLPSRAQVELLLASSA